MENGQSPISQPLPLPQPQPVTTPMEILRVAISCVLMLFIVVALPAMVAKVSMRGSMPDVTAWLRTRDAQTSIRVYDAGSGNVSSIPLNNYILGVLSAEFAPDTPMSTLEAAAVATRTYAVHAMLEHRAATRIATSANGTASASSATASTGPGSAPAPAAASAPTATSSVAFTNGADVTDDGGLDLPMATKSDVESTYPHKALRFLSNAQAAIEKTDGQVLTYQGQPILAFMFDESPGKTRSSQAVFGQNLPYLQVVNCPDDAKDPHRLSTITVTAEDVGQVFGDANINLQALKEKRGSDGFVLSVTDALTSISGPAFAAKLGLQSDDFTWSPVTATANQLKITTDGRGLDLGMSLHEAKVLGGQGESWKMLVSHFYPSTKIQLDDRYRI